MTLVRKRFINIIENLPYNIEEEIFKKEVFDILQDVTQKYVDKYGLDDLSEDDRAVINDVLCNNYKRFDILDKQIENNKN